MMTRSWAFLLIAQLLIPLALLCWLAFGRELSRAAWFSKAALVAICLIVAVIAGLWPIKPWYVASIYLVLLLLALARSSRRMHSSARLSQTLKGWLSMGLRSSLAMVVMGIALHMLSGWRPPEGPMVELAFPLKNGTYYVANGGSKELINAHLMTLSETRFRPYRGQSYGVDLLKFDSWGFRARGLAPQDPAAYAIFGDPVYAPCAGAVIKAVDEFADLPPPKTDREHMAGNHVLLDCGKAWVLLAHLQQESVQVQERDLVRLGQFLGRVGNTGNTGEPHLHIHAQRPGTTKIPFGGDPLSMLFNARYLHRNAEIDSTN
jgi:hypothetical protein